ncbi:MAG: hypothetical protein Q8T08_13675 [Ignavibacteria bacterium]|nr:hypothetical protein [Ignavibacteria bacterium]
MRIGLDIDNVITNFDEVVLAEFLKEDKNKRNTGIVNKNATWISKGMFDWSKDEIDNFFIDNMERMSNILKPLDGAKIYMDRLISDGHELFLISNRPNKHYRNPKEITSNWLRNYDINYTKLIISRTSNKSMECIDNKIDVMVDDIIDNCLQLSLANIRCILMSTKYTDGYCDGLEVAYGWLDLYDKLCR